MQLPGKHNELSRDGVHHRSPYPVKGDLRKLMKQHALPVVAPVSPELGPNEATQQALAVLQRFNIALAADDSDALKECFFADQAFWKDQLALTWHLRTFISPPKITSALLETKKQRKITGIFEIRGEASFAKIGPALVSS